MQNIIGKYKNNEISIDNDVENMHYVENMAHCAGDFDKKNKKIIWM